MNTNTTAPDQGATIVIHNEVDHQHQPTFEQWIEEIDPIISSQPGFLDKQIIRPLNGLTNTYTIIIRFQNRERLEQWMASSDRQAMLNKARHLLKGDISVSVHSGLEFLFSPATSAKTPVRWRQFLVTWSAIYPLVLIAQILLVPFLSWLGVPNIRALTVLIITGFVVYFMIYWVMPKYTLLVKDWLFK